MAQIQDTGRLVRTDISLTQDDDQCAVSAGNAWAAAGMLRVLGTLKSSSFSRNFKSQMKDLDNWVSEIHSAMYPHLVRLRQFTMHILPLDVCAHACP
jgi:hypothetical protein